MKVGLTSEKKNTNSRTQALVYIFVASLLFCSGYKLNQVTQNCDKSPSLITAHAGSDTKTETITDPNKINQDTVLQYTRTFVSGEVFTAKNNPKNLGNRVFHAVFNKELGYPLRGEKSSSSQNAEKFPFRDAADFGFRQSKFRTSFQYKAWYKKFVLLQNGEKIKDIGKIRNIFVYRLYVLALNYVSTVQNDVGIYYFEGKKNDNDRKEKPTLGNYEVKGSIMKLLRIN